MQINLLPPGINSNLIIYVCKNYRKQMTNIAFDLTIKKFYNYILVKTFQSINMMSIYRTIYSNLFWFYKLIRYYEKEFAKIQSQILIYIYIYVYILKICSFYLQGFSYCFFFGFRIVSYSIVWHSFVLSINFYH